MCRRTLCTLVALLSLSATTAWADSQIRIVRLSYTEGDVQLDRHDGQGFANAFVNLPVVENARLSTGPASHAEVEFEEGSTARLTPGSIVDFQQLRRTDGGATQTVVVVEQGQVYFNLKHRREDDFRVRVGDETFVAKKDSHFRLSLTAEGANVAVFNGDVRVLRPNGQELEVRKHEFLMVEFADAGRYFLSKNITPDAQDDWDRQRERALDAQLNSYNSLNRYGSFITVVNYGSVWRPYGVGFDWNPYQSGNWVWYPGAGYVWVSQDPWGWTPYRYGSWAYIPAVGWAWRRPGEPYPYRSPWNPGPSVWHPPQGYVPPVPPAHHNDGIIVVGHPHDWDHDRDGRGHPGSRIGGLNGDTRPGLVSPVVTPATTTNVPVDARPERGRRDVQPVNAEVVAPVQGRPERTHRTADTFVTTPVVAPQPVVVPQNTTPAVNPTAPMSAPRPSHVDRTPVTPITNNEPRGRSYTPPAQPTPTPQYTPPPRPASTPQYTPPPAQQSAPASQPAPRSSSESRGKDPK